MQIDALECFEVLFRDVFDVGQKLLRL